MTHPPGGRDAGENPLAHPTRRAGRNRQALCFAPRAKGGYRHHCRAAGGHHARPVYRPDSGQARICGQRAVLLFHAYVQFGDCLRDAEFGGYCWAKAGGMHFCAVPRRIGERPTGFEHLFD